MRFGIPKGIHKQTPIGQIELNCHRCPFSFKTDSSLRVGAILFSAFASLIYYCWDSSRTDFFELIFHIRSWLSIVTFFSSFAQIFKSKHFQMLLFFYPKGNSSDFLFKENAFLQGKNGFSFVPLRIFSSRKKRIENRDYFKYPFVLNVCQTQTFPNQCDLISGRIARGKKYAPIVNSSHWHSICLLESEIGRFVISSSFFLSTTSEVTNHKKRVAQRNREML